MPVGSQTTVTSGINALITFGTGVSSTASTNGTSTSGQKVLTVTSTAGFVQGQTIVINPGGATQETGIVASIIAGVSLQMYANLAYTHGATTETINQYYSVYGMTQNGNFTSGNKQDEEEVIGTDIPIIITAAFHADCKMTVLYSTDSANSAQFQALLQLANGQVGPINMIVTSKDATGGFRAFTWIGQLWPEKFTFTMNGAGKIISDIEGIFNARAVPT